MRCIFQFIVIIFILVGCSLIKNKKSTPIITIKPIKSIKPINQGISIIFPDFIPEIKKLKIINWSTLVIPLINKLIETQDIKLGKLLLIESINNNTNMSIQSIQVTNAIVNAINNHNIFKLVSQDIAENARKALNLSQKDNLVTRSKAIGLGRYIQTDYVLYSIISGDQQQSEIEIQLMETQTGEILWSGKNYIE
ncbi:MAG: penicillin-binding protein activator LpoB [Arsenophonus sp. ET-DL12-MAG3]